jgi:dephospho-CoA kinase
VSKWSGKYVIGLTGNIATGKSVVRKMLEHLGAYGIDADALSHRAMSLGAPGYQPVIDMFGRWILAPDRQIDRAKLAKVVFSDREALTLLEAILHPLVTQAVDLIVSRASQPVIVIEAIKLLETNLGKSCDSLWTSQAKPQVQLDRLVKFRKMAVGEAQQRIAAQPAQEQKIAAANVVIKNNGSFEDTWRQVVTAWHRGVPASAIAPAPAPVVVVAPGGKLTMERGRPRKSAEIAAFLSHLPNLKRAFSQEDIMAAFGEKAFLLLYQDQKLVGVVGWQVENLVARTTDLYMEGRVVLAEALPLLFAEMEKASKDLQCEASLLFVQPELAANVDLWKKIGYTPRGAKMLGVQAWEEAAAESMTPGSVMLFKQLRVDRILRPI